MYVRSATEVGFAVTRKQLQGRFSLAGLASVLRAPQEETSSSAPFPSFSSSLSSLKTVSSLHVGYLNGLPTKDLSVLKTLGHLRASMYATSRAIPRPCLRVMI